MKQKDNRSTSLVVSPDMLILARESRGLAQKELAARLGVSQGRVSKMEMGLLPVPQDLLDQIAVALHYPTHFFYEGARIGVGIAELFHRKRQDIPQRTLEKIYARIEICIVKHIWPLTESVVIEGELPHMDIDSYDGEAERIAALLRVQWQMPPGPVQDLTQTIEAAGVVVVPFDFETTRVDAVSRWVPGKPPVVFVNVGVPKDRLRYSLAHELGHLVMHALPTPTIENEANRFAAEFLLPRREVHADLGDLNLAKLAVLKRYWKVSMQALLKRAEDLATISGSRARYLWAQMAAAGYKMREPVELDVTGEAPTLLHEIIDTHLSDLGYTTGEVQQLMAIHDDEFVGSYLGGTRQGPRLRVLSAL